VNARPRWRRLGVPFLVVSSLLSVASARSADISTNGAPQGFVFIVNEENDKFVIPTTDKHYTQGLHFSLLWPDNDIPMPLQWLAFVPDLGIDDATHKYGITVGQDIFTPKDTKTSSVVTNDRPYAGWLYFGLVREDRGTSFPGLPTLDHIELDLGVIGPDALAENAQNWFHSIIGANPSHGWDHQLPNEPGLLLLGQRKWLLWESGTDDALKVQMIPNVTLSLGNVITAAQIGTTVRVGHHIPDEFSKTMVPRVGWYAFGGIDARGVLYNAFLDGTLGEEDASHVDKSPGAAVLHAGAGVVFKHVEFSYTYNYLTREFQHQKNYDAYGSLNLVWRF
jgi:lipid A 3-O-deacylase